MSSSAVASCPSAPAMSTEYFGVYQSMVGEPGTGYSYFTPPSMSGPGLEWSAVEKLMHADEDRFEEAVSSMGVRELLDLVSGLQSAMAEEQRRFDALGLQLQRWPLSQADSDEQRALSAALCASQLKLARLCARNMRCFTQQAIRAKEDQAPEPKSGSSRAKPLAPSPLKNSSMCQVVDHDFADEEFGSTDEELKNSRLIRQNLLDISDFDEVEAAFSSMMEDGTGDEPPAVAPYDGRFHDEDDVMDGDYDSRDFVVHRNTFNSVDDYNSEDSTTHGSPQSDSLRWRPPERRLPHHDPNDRHDDDRRSPDYASSEEEADYRVDYAYEDEDSPDFVDNSDAYATDPRRYVYYPEEKELEVIPEEDEEELREQAGSREDAASDCSYGDPPYNHDRSKLAVANECDSGVTDDQRSSCGEEEGGGDDPYGLGSSRSHPKAPGSSEDADSAQGSLLLESSDSPSALDCVPLAEEPQQDGVACPVVALARPEEDATPTSRSSVSVQCNGPDSLQKVLQAQGSMSLPEERRVNPPPAKTSSSKLAHLIQSFESVSVAPEVPVRRRYNANLRSLDATPTENGRPTSPKQSRITPSLPPLASLPKTTTVRTTSSPPSCGGVASSRNVTLPVNVPLQRANATMLSASLPVTFATGATTSVTRVSFATNDAGTNLVTPKTNSLPDVNGVSNGGSSTVLAGRDALCSAEAVEEERMPRSSTLFWDPTELLKELYSVEPPQLHGRDLGGVEYVNKEGYLDMMPSNRKKATYWNPWKRRYFRLCDGNLSCFESENSQRPFVKAQLMGGNIDTLENNMIGIDDRKGHYIAVKCSSERDAEAWLDALHSQCQDNFAKSFVQPVLRPLASHKRVIVVDMGGCSIRAGILMDQPTMPTVYFPSVCSTDKNTGQQTFGIEALTPEVRKTSHLTFPLVPSAKISKFTMDVEALPGLMRKIFRDLGITNPSQYKVQVCVPRSFSLQTQVALARALLEGLGVGGLSVTHQAICALYAYNTTSGIVVDLGDRLDIVPITDGYIVEGGVTRLPYGAHKLAHHLRQALVQKRVSLFSDVDLYLVRYVQQQACYVAGNYAQELRRFHFDPDSVEKSVPIGRFFQQDCPAESVSVDVGRFQAPEGLFQPELWGLDSGGVHKLVQRALQECSMDIRREMARSIYLSGGLTLLPGFAERLQAELDTLTPDTVTPKVHASPYREHMAFLGASTMASTSAFDGVCVTLREWQQQGAACLAKWHL